VSAPPRGAGGTPGAQGATGCNALRRCSPRAPPQGGAGTAGWPGAGGAPGEVHYAPPQRQRLAGAPSRQREEADASKRRRPHAAFQRVKRAGLGEFRPARAAAFRHLMHEALYVAARDGARAGRPGARPHRAHPACGRDETPECQFGSLPNWQCPASPSALNAPCPIPPPPEGARRASAADRRARRGVGPHRVQCAKSEQCVFCSPVAISRRRP